MSLTHETAVRNGLAQVVADAVDGGTGAGQMVLKAGANEVATIPFNDPAFGSPSAGVLTLDVAPVPEDGDATGNASAVDSVEVQDGDSTVIYTGDNVTGAAGGGDIELSKNPIDATDIVQITSYSYTASV